MVKLWSCVACGAQMPCADPWISWMRDVKTPQRTGTGKGLLCRSSPINGSFVLFNLLGSLLQTACLGWWSCSDLSSLSSKPSLPTRASIHVNRDLPCKHRRQNLQWRRKISKMTMADMWMARSDDAAVGLLARRLVTAIKIHSVMRPKVM